MVIDDILEELRNEEIALGPAVEEIRKRVGEIESDSELQGLYDRVDLSQQKGLPSSQARTIRECLDQLHSAGPGLAELQTPSDSNGAGDNKQGDDDLLELSLEPAEEPAKPRGGVELVDDDSASEEDGAADEGPQEDKPPAGATGAMDQITGRSEDKGGLPPIQPEESGEEATASASEDDGPADTEDADADPDHQVVMETRGSLPSSHESRPDEGPTDDDEPRGVGRTTTMVGALLGGRFELLSRVSHDPYGAVYRARDLESESTDPNEQMCGIRILPSALAGREDVLRRTEAIIKRMRRLQHQRLLNPSALHRDEGQAWIVTELPAGMTLARFIRRECVKGLPVDRAMKIIGQIAEALKVAHQADVCHGDLKPASILIDEEDRIKVGDFGLRLALFGKEPPGSQAGSTEIEQMDPMDAYLTLEVMEGAPPTPADDIYALACITAGLLNGGHPFNGQSGLRRLEKDLPTPRIKGLTRYQRKVLAKGFAVYRSDRPNSVDEFMQDLAIRRGPLPKAPLAAAAGVVVAVAAAWIPLQNWLESRQHEQQAASIDQEGWPALRGSLRMLDADEREAILPRVEDSAVRHYANAVERAIDDNDPLEADLLLTEGLRHFPEAQALRTLRPEVEAAETALVNTITARLQALADQGALGIREEEDDVPTLLNQLQRLQTDHEMADTEYWHGHYRDAAAEAVAEADPVRVRELVEAGERIFDDQAVISEALREALVQAETRAAEQAAADLLPAVERGLPVTSVEEALALKDDWRALLVHTGSHPLIVEHSGIIGSLMARELDQLIEEERWAEANEFIRDTAVMWPTDQLATARRELTRAQLAADYRPASLRAERQGLTERREQVEALVEDPRMTPVWSGELLLAWREMLTWMRPGRGWHEELEEQLESLYLSAIEEAIAEGDRERARDLGRRGHLLLPDSHMLRQHAGA
ncbi:protein kinase [Gammaproteobacteria bacterium AB-CW1]|uniref:Protein kinase n=1 Tax=Natronospira elongata TaxID=3110268 RepID=A0AAP6JEW2_9GAMM|nr:protein kinase [Gammaproteobacteria bacterium AB-CW1]